jgi:cell wall-associated NlpC family hydrolase
VIFYSTMHHVAIYAGNGMVIHAPHTGSVVKYEQMSYMPFAGAVRPG